MRRGTIGEQPWGLTLASFAVARGSGQLTITADDGKLYCVAFAEGQVVGASSPLASDSAARVALTSHLVSSTQVPALAKAVAAAPARDEIEVVAEHAHLTPEQTEQLRRRLLVQRVARTFSVDRGGYSFGEQVTIATMRGVSVDVAPAIYLGVRMNLAQERLAEDLRRLGARFVLRTEDVDPARFGFTDAERPILQALRIGTSLPDLEAKRRELEPRTTQAVIYTLVATGVCEGLAAPRTREPSIAPPIAPRTREPSIAPPLAVAAAAAVEPAVVATAPTAPSVPSVPVVMVSAPAPAPVRVVVPPPRGAEDDDGQLARARTITFDGPTKPRVTRQTAAPRARTISSAPPPVARATSVFAAREVIAAGVALLELQADHYALLGVSQEASLDAIRTAYVSLACHLHPDKLPELDPATTRDAQRLFAQVNQAYGVLSDPVRRAEYTERLRSEPPKVVPRARSRSTAPGAAGLAAASAGPASGTVPPAVTAAAAAASAGPSAGPSASPSLPPAAAAAAAAAASAASASASVAAPAAEPRSGTSAERARAAAEVAQRGMQALRREDLPSAVELLTRATELAPQDVDYASQLAWARFCAASDKAAIAPEVRRVLERAIFKSQRPALPRFFLGRVERMLGRVREALHHFHEVIVLDPNHAEAAAEIRLLEPRSARR